MPPLPPDVVAQQMPAPLRFMQAAGGAVPQANSGQQFDPNAYVADQLSQVAALLKNVAQVLVTEKPALMPILQHMVQAGSALMNELTAGQGKDGPAPGQGDVNPQMPQPSGSAGAVSMS